MHLHDLPVITHTQARHVLEAKGNLDEAHASTEPVGTQFTRSLIGARERIGEAARSLRAYDGRDQSLLEIAEDVKETAQHASRTWSFRLRRPTTGSSTMFVSWETYCTVCVFLAAS